MNRMLTLFAVLSAMALMSSSGNAQNLLLNGNLNATTQVGDPAIYYPEPTSWTLTTDPCSTFPCAIVRFPGNPAPFAEHANPGAPGTNGILFNSTEGNFPGFPDVLTVDAEIKQSVAGTPGVPYKMTGWAYFEGGYAGGVDNLSPLAPAPRGGQPSLTDTFFALEFLGAGDVVLPGSVQIELKEAGQVNNPSADDSTPELRAPFWKQHTLMGVAPAGTLKVQVRAAMVDGEFNVDMPHQAAWVDDFELTIVPEPASWFLGLLGLGLAGAVRRRG